MTPRSENPLAVLDASVGVKWVKPESGSGAAVALLSEHRSGALRIVVPVQFIHEVIATAVRARGADFGELVWVSLQDAELTVVGLDDTLARAAFDQCRLLGCSFYDALAPAVAQQLDATLYSADARARGRFDGVVLLA